MPSRILLVILLGCFTTIISAQDYEIITPENADQLQYVAKLGRGYVTDIEFVDNETFEIHSGSGTWQYHVHDMTAPPLFTPFPISPITGDEPIINHVSVHSDDGNWMIGQDGVWSTKTNERVFEFSGYDSIPAHIMVSNYLVVWRTNYPVESNQQCTVDTPCVDPIVVINMFTKQTYGVVFADDIEGIHIALNGTHIAIQRTNSTDFYSLHNPNQLEFAFTISASITHISQDGNYGITRSWEDHYLSVWDLQTRTRQLHLTYQKGEFISAYHLSSDGRYLAVVTNQELYVEGTYLYEYRSQDKNIGIWDTQTGQRLTIIPYFAPRIDMKFSDDGGYFVAYSQSDVFYGTEKGTFFLTLYETQTGRQIAQIDNGYWRPTSDVAFSPDAQYLAITFYDGRIVLINTTTGEIEFDEVGYNGYVSQLNFYDGYVITSSTSNYSDWWDLDTLEHVRRDEKCLTLGIDPIGERVVCLYQWSFDEAELIPFRLKDIDTDNMIEADDERLNWDWLLNTTFSPDGHQFVTQSDNINPNVWDAKTLEFITTLEANYLSDVRGFQYLADGAYIGSQSHGVIWDATTFEIIAQVDSVAGINDRGVYSEAGDWVAFPDWQSNSIIIWRLSDLYTNSNPEPLVILSDFRSDGCILSASPDGHLLAITSSGITTLVETDTFNIIHQYRAGGLEVQFSPDGRYIIHADGICLACGADESLHIGSADVWAVPSS